MSRFIKNLLYTEELPLLDVVTKGDLIIKDCLYIYGEDIIRCTGTGRLEGDDTIVLVPSNDLFPSSALYSGGIRKAEFEFVSRCEECEKNKVFYKYRSNTNYYDGETHKHLGNYIRYFKNKTGIDLMPFYNCYTSDVIEGMYLQPPKKDSPTYILETNDSYKVLAIPIKFNKTYTIAVDCGEPVQMRAVIYDKNAGMIVDNSGGYYSDRLESSYTRIFSSLFSRPFTFKVETEDYALYQQQRNLHLLIQIPSHNNSSISVLEGKYTDLHVVHTNENTVRSVRPFRNLSLLNFNTKQSYAFSDRLVEYLLLNVITSQEEISDNLDRVQSALADERLGRRPVDTVYDSLVDNHRVTLGAWGESLQQAVLRVVEDNSTSYYFRDQDGNVNKDMEKFLMLKGVYST